MVAGGGREHWRARHAVALLGLRGRRAGHRPAVPLWQSCKSQLRRVRAARGVAAPWWPHRPTRATAQAGAVAA